MKRMRIFGRLLAVVIVALLLALCGSCGKRNAKTVAGGSASVLKSGQAILNGRPVPPLADLLSELDALQKPPSVSPQLWASLKNELRDKLVSAFSSAKKTNKLGGLTVGYVKARDLQWEPTSPGITPDWGKLTWRYVNDGDYNQDGQVKIDDVTPVAMYYGQSVEADNSIQELIDEDEPGQDGDGIIDKDEDGLGASDDIETIATNFYADVASCEVFGREAQGNWVSLGTVPFSSRTQRDSERDVFSFSLNADYANYKYYKVRALSATPGTLAPPLGPEYWYHTDPNDPGGSIVESDVLELGAPVVTGVTPRTVHPGVPEQYEATLSDFPGDITACEWVFVVFGEPMYFYTLNPEVTFEDKGINSYIVTGCVWVTSQYGTSVLFPFDVEVTKDGIPPDIISVTPSSVEGEDGEGVSFEAVVDGDPPFTYAWDFDGGATPNTSTEVEPTVYLDNPGVHQARLTVTNDYGSDYVDIPLTVHGWATVEVDDTGGELCLARDQNDEPGICYQADSKDLKYAYRVGGVWETHVTDPGIEIPGVHNITVGCSNSLAFNPEPSAPGFPEPSIAYEFRDHSWDEVREEWHLDRTGIRFARLVEGQWELHLSVPNEVMTLFPDPSLAFEGSKPFISYYKDSSDFDLKLAFEDPVGSGVWDSRVVEDGGSATNYRGVESSMIVDASGKKLIAHNSLVWEPPNPSYESQLRLVRYIDMLCIPEVVDATTSGDTGHCSSIALTPGGSVWIAYLHDFSGHGFLKVARESFPSGGSWDFNLLDAGGLAGPPTLKISTQGVAGISYSWRQTEHDDPVLKYVANHSGIWDDPVVVTEDTTDACSLAFTSDGRPSIAYVANGNLYYTELF